MIFSASFNAMAARLGAWIALSLACTVAPAQNATVFLEQGQLVRANQNVTAFGADLVGDKVNLYSGALEFSETDVSLPGNNALPVSVARRYVTGNLRSASTDGLFGDWDLEIPHLHGVFAAGQTTQAQSQGWVVDYTTAAARLLRCSNFGPPPSIGSAQFMAIPGPSSAVPSSASLFSPKVAPGGGGAVWDPDQFWAGNLLYVPGVGDEKMLLRDTANTTKPTDGYTYPVVTKSNWQFRCITGLASPKTANGTDTTGEGFVAVSPDGTNYKFNWMVSRAYQGLSTSAGPLVRQEVWILPTLVTDRFGNTVTYTYDTTDPWKLKTIVASDGRTLTLSYVTGHRVDTVFDGSRTWNYTYVTTNNARLTQVTLPDTSAWYFSMAEQASTPQFSPKQGCFGTPSTWSDGTLLPNSTTSTITHPSGATASFTLSWVTHGRSMASPGNPCPNAAYTADDLITPVYAVRSLVSKSISGPGLPGSPTMTWNYAWGPANGTWNCAGTCPGTSAVTVTDARNYNTRQTFANVFMATEGQLQRTDEGWDGTNAVRTTQFYYRAAGAGPYPRNPGSSGSQSGVDYMETTNLPQYQRTISQQAATFTWQATAFDNLVRVTAATRSSSLGYTKSESTVYGDNTTKWVTGQVGSETIAGIVASSTSYDQTTALPTAKYQFGKLQASYTFNNDGTLYIMKDGLNQPTTFTNYKRGLAQNIAYADSSTESAVVNDLGMV